MKKWMMLFALIFSMNAVSALGSELRPFDEHWIASGVPSLRLYLRHLPAKTGAAAASSPVLFIHGATFPSGLAAGYRFGGYSWMDYMSQHGFDVWALDYLGYGNSDRYPEMNEPADKNPPLGRADVCSRQVAAAVDFIRSYTKSPRVSLVAHSWGTIVAGIYAAQNASNIDRLVLFGPIAQRNGDGKPQQAKPAWTCVSAQEQRDRFYGYVPAGVPRLFAPRLFARWGHTYMATDPDSRKRTPPCVKVPNGFDADLEESWTGKLPYDPGLISNPVLIVRGEWEVVTRNEDAQWLYQRLRSAPLRRDVLISKATHVMHLEDSRFQLYAEVATFLNGEALERP